MKSEVPKEYGEKSFGVTIPKGHSKDGKNHLFSWNAVSNCMPHKCTARNECPYEKIGKCSVQTKYLRAVERVIFANYATALTEDQMFRVGMHLIPMYKIMSRLMIEELGVKKIIYKDKNKRRVVHPVYKEIRETIKAIESAWKSLGLTPVTVPKSPVKKQSNKNGRAIME